MNTCRDNKEVIRRFDEVLCTKASKFSIDQLKNELNMYFKLEDQHQFAKKLNDKHDEITESSGKLTKHCI